jgi:hypothetical protein
LALAAAERHAALTHNSVVAIREVAACFINAPKSMKKMRDDHPRARLSWGNAEVLKVKGRHRALT